ncbi:MAG TPA: hypothetical protein VGJ18_24290 [Gemmatimonadaceae bacterium]|jgi:hypothetical protein
MKQLKPLTGMCAAALLIACAASASAPAGVRILTADATLGPNPGESATVRFTLVNEGPSTVLVPRCGDNPTVAVERWQTRNWAEYASGLCLAYLRMDPMVLAPGASLEGRVAIAEAGEYRLVLIAVGSDLTATSAPLTIRQLVVTALGSARTPAPIAVR